MITNENGWVLLRHRNSNPKTVNISEDNTVYSFSTANPSGQVKCAYVSAAWVRPEHVDRLLAHLSRVCCGKRAETFHPANELDMKLWLTGER